VRCALTDHYRLASDSASAAGVVIDAGAGTAAMSAGGSGGGSDAAGGASGTVGVEAGAAGEVGAGDCAPSCTGQQTCCGASCVDTSSDAQNCGACGQACDAGRSCSGGACSVGWATIAAPPAGFVGRNKAAATAMGGDVFIWGGADAIGTIFDTGAIYSPASDSWTPVVKDANTPTPRILATALWTGRLVIVFGGTDVASTTSLNNGAAYDPAAKAWTQLPAAINRRSAASAFWDGQRALFCGGTNSSGAAVAGCDRFNLTTWTTSNYKGDPGAIAAPAAAFDGATLYLEGGLVGNAVQDGVASYTSRTDSWLDLSKSLSARSNSFGAWDGSHFLVWGGRDSAAPRSDGAYLIGSTWVPMTAVGAPSARLASVRDSGWGFAIGPGLIAIVGGQTALNGTLAHDGATYDVSANAWKSIPTWPSNEDHENGVGVWTGAEFVLWSGRSGGAPTITGERIAF
jgi:hypothetical protein